MPSIYENEITPQANVFQEQIAAEKPKSLNEQEVYVYVPRATTENPGIASFDSTYFHLNAGKVYPRINNPAVVPSLIKIREHGVDGLVYDGDGYLSTYLKTINNQSLIGTDNIDLATKYEFDNYTDATNTTLSNLDGRIGAIETDITTGHIPTLDASGKLPISIIPVAAITETYVVNSQAAMLALNAQVGDVAIRTDESRSYILQTEPASILANWKELLSPTAGVLSVNGQIGTVVLDADDISDEETTHKFTTAEDIAKLSGIEAGAQVNTVTSVNTKTGEVVLDADDIDDSETTNKFVTADDIAAWNAKQDVLTAGSHITISDNVISGEEGVTTIESDTFDVTSYDSGVYRWKSPATETATLRTFNAGAGVVTMWTTDELNYMIIISEVNGDSSYNAYVWFQDVGFYAGTTGVGNPKWYSYTAILQTSDVVNALNSQSTTAPLSANQGYLLNQNKQDKLVSGTNIKTINNTSLLGTGDIIISDTGATSVDTSGSGNAFTSVSYDSATRKITFTKGETFVKTSDIDNALSTSSTNPVQNKVISLLIPSQASSDNQLADKAFVNSTVGTNTAIFRGTYNLVSDLGLTTSATELQITTALASTITTVTNNDYCYVEVPTADATPTQISHFDRYKYSQGSGWAFEYTLNNSSFTAVQWAAINSTITEALVTKLNGIESGAQVNTVTSVNTKTGAVVLDADDISDSSTTNKFVTAADLTKLSGIESGAQVNTVTSVNTKTGAIVLDADDISDSSTTNKFVTATEKSTWSGKQDALVSGTNIKTINGSSVLGSGDLTISTGASPDMLADEYSASSTYAVGDLVWNAGKLYRCTTAVTTAGAFNAQFWTETTVEAELNRHAMTDNVVTLDDTNNTFSGHKTLIFRSDKQLILKEQSGNTSPIIFTIGNSYGGIHLGPDGRKSLEISYNTISAVNPNNCYLRYYPESGDPCFIHLPHKTGTILLSNSVFPDFNKQSTYAVGDYATYTGKLYRCTTAITTSGSDWNASKWTEVTIGALLNTKQDIINSSNKLSADLIDTTGTTNQFVTATEKSTWDGKQDALVSGTNIKTINNESLLGSGNITISGSVTITTTTGSESISDGTNTLNVATRDTTQNITGSKTFVGSQILNFKQSASTDKLGFTAYDTNDKEVGNLQIASRSMRPIGSSAASSYMLVSLGNYTTDNTTYHASQIGFRVTSDNTSSPKSYNVLAPKDTKANINALYGSTYDTIYMVTALTDGTNNAFADKKGLANISSLIGSLATPNLTDSSAHTQSGHGTVIESYLSSDKNMWYRVWSDGWKECGGKATKSGEYSRITFPLPSNYQFSNTYYTVMATSIHNENDTWDDTYTDWIANTTGNPVTATAFSYRIRSGSATFCWYACGY